MSEPLPPGGCCPRLMIIVCSGSSANRSVDWPRGLCVGDAGIHVCLAHSSPVSACPGSCRPSSDRAWTATTRGGPLLSIP